MEKSLEALNASDGEELKIYLSKCALFYLLI